jgi:phospholipid transport system transporter-binding protein
MSEAEALIEQVDGGFALSGKLTRENVAEIWTRGVEKFVGQTRIDLNLAKVSICDTAGVAMLVDWLRVARVNGQELRFSGAPEQMLAIARVSDLVQLLDDPEGQR